MSIDTDRIRLLNDELRQHLIGGGVLITPSAAALGAEAVKRLVPNPCDLRCLLPRERPLRRARLWGVRFRRQICLLQNRFTTARI